MSGFTKIKVIDDELLQMVLANIGAFYASKMTPEARKQSFREISKNFVAVLNMFDTGMDEDEALELLVEELEESFNKSITRNEGTPQ